MKYWLFGAGNFGNDYINRYGCENIVGIVDSNVQKHNTRLGDVRICSYEEFLDRFDKENERIIICIFWADGMYLRLLDDSLEPYISGFYKMGVKREGVSKEGVPYEDFWNISVNSFYGEELGLRHYFDDYPKDYKGIYVDVGAYHPFLSSNTRWAYELGWKGINIDASEQSIRLFEKYRPTDINIHCGVSDTEGEMKYYLLRNDGGPGAMNSFVLDDRIKDYVVGEKTVRVRKLNDILDEVGVKEIDFIDIDVEGMDEKIIDSFDWKRFAPKCALIEILDASTVDEIVNSTVHKKMRALGYQLRSYYTMTALYIKE